jgi:hypothetical protein
MQDKSSYSSQHQSISEDLQNYINAMVEEIVFEKEDFTKNRKWLKKYLEAEDINYEEYEQTFLDFFELLTDYKNTKSSTLQRLLRRQAELCFIKTEILEKLLDSDNSIHHEEKCESPEPVITTFSIFPPTCESGNDIVLSWEVKNADKLYLQTLPNLSLLGINSLHIKNVTENKAFTLVAENGKKQVQCTENVKVIKHITDRR